MEAGVLCVILFAYYRQRRVIMQQASRSAPLEPLSLVLNLSSASQWEVG